MEFWGVEVKGGQPLKVVPEDGCVIHISQAALGEAKKEKGTDFIPLKLKINGSTIVVGTLSAEKFPQLTFDLVLEKEFELSHDWKNGSVYFCGYSADNTGSYPDSEEDDSFDEEDEPQFITQNGNTKPEVVKAKGIAAKPETSAKPAVKVVEPEKDDDSDEDDSDDIDDSDEDDSEMDSEDDEDSDDSEDDSEDEETPKKVEPAKKRTSESVAKTPLSSKKAKLETPQKTDGKKGSGHVATPHPSKQGGKTPASGNKSKGKEQSPKSAGKLSCGSCSKSFNSDGALQSHAKAKHAAK